MDTTTITTAATTITTTTASTITTTTATTTSYLPNIGITYGHFKL